MHVKEVHHVVRHEGRVLAGLDLADCVALR